MLRDFSIDINKINADDNCYYDNEKKEIIFYITTYCYKIIPTKIDVMCEFKLRWNYYLKEVKECENGLQVVYTQLDYDE